MPESSELLAYHPTEGMKQQLRNYVTKLTEDDNCLPYVVDLEEVEKDGNIVLLMNEGKLGLDNYERLLRWRLGHANSKVLKAMDLIDNKQVSPKQRLLLLQSG